MKKIGQGAFGEIFSGRNIITGEAVAIKVERVDSQKQVLKLEVAVLKKLQACPWVVPFIACGRHTDYNFLVMELLGENIADLRRSQQGRFSMLTTLKLGIQMLKGIEAVHEFGYLHRDVKPSNFAMGLSPSKKSICFLIDFGLARRYMLNNGDIRPPRDCAGFRGTARYASINSHQSKDLGRRDDLWSLFYLMVEFAQGQLPWRRIKDKDKVGEMKIKYNSEELVAGLPPEFLEFMAHLQGLQYHSKPDYKFLINMFGDLYKKLGGTDKTPFDWDRPRTASVRRSRPLPSLMDFCFMKVVADINKVARDADAQVFARIPHKIKKRMFELLLRLNDGVLPRWLLERLLDNNVQELDLTKSRLAPDEISFISSLLTQLRSLTLGETTDDVVREFVQRNEGLESISIVGSKGLSGKITKVIAASCPRLKAIHIEDSEKVSDKHLEHLFKTCDNLVDLSIINCKKVHGTALKMFAGDHGTLRNKKPQPFKLRSLDLSGCPLNKQGLKKLSKLTENLTSLRLAPLAMVAKGSTSEVAQLVRGCYRLKNLALTSGHSGDVEEAFGDIAAECRQLESIELGAKQLTEQFVVDILTTCSLLREIIVSQEFDNGFAATSLPRTLRLCTSLEKISIKFGTPGYKPSTISDSAMKGMLHACMHISHLSLQNCLILSGSCFPDHSYYPYLEYLDLSDCAQLYDSAVRKVAECSPFLTTLKLNRLNNLTKASLDAIAVHCPLLEECHMKGVVCFPDQDLMAFVRKLVKLFLFVTRYTKRDTIGIDKEVHYSTVEEVFLHYPNEHRDFVFANLSHPVGT